MTETSLPSPEILRKLLRYEPNTGYLYWLPRSVEFFKSDANWKAWNVRFSETQAFKSLSDGYRRGRIFGKTYPAHRVIWAMQTNDWPTDQIDHIDRDRQNNCWANLRNATLSENRANIACRSGGTSGFLGVHWHKRDCNWHAMLSKNGKRVYLGSFIDEQMAAKAYDEAAKRLHGEFANLNFPEARL
jgi:hypothetical protein